MINDLGMSQSRLTTWATTAKSSPTAESRLGPAVLHALLSQLPVGVLVTDRKGRIIYENEFARRVLGGGGSPGRSGVTDYVASDRITADGAPYAGFHPDGSPYQKMEWPMARALLLGEVVRDEEMDFRSPDGTRRWLSVSASPVRSAPGKIDAAVVTCTDITAIKRAKEWEPIMESLARL